MPDDFDKSDHRENIENMQKNVTSEHYCNHSVNQHDHNRYLISLFAKTSTMKRGLWALYAFNYEIAKTREIVTDTTLGLIRLVWWREALRMIYNMPTEQKRNLDDHPLLPELAAAINEFNLPYELFDQILLGREFDLEDVQPQTLDGLLTYLDNTNAPLITLTALISGLELGKDIQQVDITALARANGLAGLLRAIPYHAQHQIVMLPSEMVEKSAVIAGEREKLISHVKELHAQSAASLKRVATTPKGPIRAIYKITKINLDCIKKAQFDPTQKKFNQDIAFLALKLAL